MDFFSNTDDHIIRDFESSELKDKLMAAELLELAQMKDLRSFEYVCKNYRVVLKDQDNYILIYDKNSPDEAPPKAVISRGHFVEMTGNALG